MNTLEPKPDRPLLTAYARQIGELKSDNFALKEENAKLRAALDALNREQLSEEEIAFKAAHHFST